MNLYIEILEPGTYQACKLVQHIIVIRTETRQRINAINRSKGIYFSVYLYFITKLFVCVKRQCMSKNSNTSLGHQQFRINFWCLVLFTYWKVILGNKKIWQSMISSYGQRRNIIFLENCTLVWSDFFQINTFSSDLKIQKQVWKLSHKLF